MRLGLGAPSARSPHRAAFAPIDVDDSDDGERQQSEPRRKMPLNFFNLQVARARADSASDRDELSEVISAARTSICGQKFDRCELEFGADRVELTIWKDNKRRWQGQVKYAHMVRFCFAKVNRPPYILLLQLDNAKGRSDFATFYDPIFAKVCAENEFKEQTTPRVYGIVFYFDEAVDYTRCQSMGDNIPRLAHLFKQQLSEGEAQEYSRMDVASRLRNARRSETKPSSTSSAGGHNFLANGAKAIASFFRPRSGTSVLEADDNPSVIRDHGGSTRGRTLNLSCESNEVSSADYGEEKAPIQIDDKPDCGSDAMKGGEGVVVIQTAELGESDSKTASTDTFVSSPLQQEEKTSEIVENRKRAASSRREDEKLKRREIESRRNEVLLTYPYDGSDTAGRISVTLGDIDRLVPGEFLNDNIIDFYLRFLWRHLESWQQQQMYFFTSHFFTQLNGTNGAHELTTTDPDERFARVARWTQKETNLFNKQFLFIPINDSFHWSIAVFCNPGSAIIKIRRNIKRRRRVICKSENDVVDLVNGDGDAGEVSTEAIAREDTSVEEEVEEEEVQSCQEDRLAHPPCLLFLDSLRCHRKKKFTKMLRNYLECEWRARFAPSADDNALKTRSSVGADEVEEEETIVTSFDSESISLIEPNIPLQSNSSDCGVFLLMYAASIVRLFPAGVTREDLENKLSATLTSSMFRDEHVLEFREYLQQLLFCLQFLERHGLPEEKVRDEELETFTID